MKKEIESIPAFAFLLKTYPKDYRYAKRLIESYHKYNQDGIKMFIVTSDNGDDLRESGVDTTNINFLREDEFPHLVESEIGGLSQGYINQEIIKISFWEMGLCENYMCLDSDGMFIREFWVSDFMYDKDIPYTVMYDDMELKTDPVYYETFWKPREESLKKIQRELGFDLDKKLWTCHGFQIFNAEVLRSFKSDFMEPRNYSYRNLMEISPYEFSWYNYYLQRSRVMPVYLAGPLFRTFHTKEQLVLSGLADIKLEDLGRGYIGIVVNSNFNADKEGRFDNLLPYHFSVPTRYMPFLMRECMREILRKAKHGSKKMYDKICRYFNKVGDKV